MALFHLQNGALLIAKPPVALQLDDAELAELKTIIAEPVPLPPPTTQIRVGHYVFVGGKTANSDEAARRTQVMQDIRRSEASEHIKGIWIDIGWGFIERQAGLFDWALVDEVMAWLDARGKAAAVQLSYKSYTDSSPIITPPDIPAIEFAAKGFTAAIWSPAVLARFVAFLAAFAERYDGHPVLEAVFTDEVAPTGKDILIAHGFTDSSYNAAIRAINTKLGKLFTQSTPLADLSYYLNPPTLQALLEHAVDAGLGLYAIDAMDTHGVKAWRGEYGGPDFRGRPFGAVVSPHVLGNTSIADVLSWAAQNKVSYLYWYPYLKAPQSWAEMLVLIEAQPRWL
jgi:hypothetical protein